MQGAASSHHNDASLPPLGNPWQILAAAVICRECVAGLKLCTACIISRDEQQHHAGDQHSRKLLEAVLREALGDPSLPLAIA